MAVDIFFIILVFIIAGLLLSLLFRRPASDKKTHLDRLPDKEAESESTLPPIKETMPPSEVQPPKRRAPTELYRRPASTTTLPTQESVQPETEIEKPAVFSKELPPTSFPPFDNSRLLEMGLSKNEADSFVVELIEQIESTLPQIDDAAEKKEFEKVERLTHSLKGSATNLGTGGVADILVAFNTYTKTGEDGDIIAAHIQNLKNYLKELKVQFS